MPAYLIVHAERRGDDTLLEDDQLSLDLTPGWAVFTDAAGTCYVVPRERIGSIQRIDEEQNPEDQKPAPAKE